MSIRILEKVKKERGWYYIGKDIYYWRTCNYCGKEYQGMGKFYCSKSCRLKDKPIFLSGENHHMKNPEIAKKVSEKLKGRKLSSTQRDLAIKALRDYTFTKEDLEYRKSRMPRKENHWRWKEDRSLIVNRRGKDYYQGDYKNWSISVKERDGWKCKINNSDCVRKLQSHHILNWVDYPELRFDINNGITLCLVHHPKGRTEEKRQEVFLRSLVTVSRN